MAIFPRFKSVLNEQSIVLVKKPYKILFCWWSSICSFFAPVYWRRTCNGSVSWLITHKNNFFVCRNHLAEFLDLNEDLWFFCISLISPFQNWNFYLKKRKWKNRVDFNGMPFAIFSFFFFLDTTNTHVNFRTREKWRKQNTR